MTAVQGDADDDCQEDVGPARGQKGAGAKHATTKKERLIRMLKRKAGADVATLSAMLGWQAHTTRAELSRLRKAGYSLTRDEARNGKPVRYRIVGELAAGGAA